jgi:hypothetical protein
VVSVRCVVGNDNEVVNRKSQIANPKFMDWLWWLITFALMLTGLAGTLLPVLPGTTLIMAGALVHRLAFGPERGVGWGCLLGMLALLVLSLAVDLLGGMIGAKWSGASRWGAIGAVVGATVGIFFGLPGLLLGPLAGALVCELIAGKAVRSAAKSAWGTFIGTTAAAVAKFAIGIAMVTWFLFALAWR